MTGMLGKQRARDAKAKSAAHEMYLTYDLRQKGRDGGSTMRPKVKRVYISGDVKGWQKGMVRKRSGREVYGVLIEYEQFRADTSEESAQRFRQVVEAPREARNVRFYFDAGGLPEKYRDALENVR